RQDMKVQNHHWSGVTATVYHLDRGEKIARHQHAHVHSTVVLRGSTSVTVFFADGDHQIQLMDSESSDVILSANLDHEIVAEEDGTIVMNMAGGGHAEPPQQAGITYDP